MPIKNLIIKFDNSLLESHNQQETDSIYHSFIKQSVDRLTAFRLELEYLNTIGKRFVAAIDRFQVHQALMAALQELYSFAAYSILLKGEPYQLSIIPRYPLNPSFLQAMLKKIAQGASVLDFRVTADELAEIAYLDAPDELAQLYTAAPIGATEIGDWLNIPLTVENRVIGLLSLFDEHPGTFDTTRLQLTTIIADYASIALENVGLLERELALWHQSELDRQRLELILNSLEGDLLITKEGIIISVKRYVEQLLAQAKVEFQQELPTVLDGLADPVTLILAALAVGAATSIKEIASEAVKDAYKVLKALIQNGLVGKPKAQMTLVDYEDDPEMNEEPLKKALLEAGVDQEKDIIEAAQRLITLVQSQQAAMGKYNAQITGNVQGGIVGDNVHVTMSFGNEPTHVKESARKPEEQGTVERGESAQDEFRQKGENSRARDSKLSVIAIARAELEEDDRALIGKAYSVQAGISQNKLENYEGEPFDLSIRTFDEPLPFDILLHASKNIELLTERQKHLHYHPRDPEPQLVEFTFRVVAPGVGSLDINFYHERRWLRTIHFEFDAVEQSQLSGILLEE